MQLLLVSLLISYVQASSINVFNVPLVRHSSKHLDFESLRLQSRFKRSHPSIQNNYENESTLKGNPGAGYSAQISLGSPAQTVTLAAFTVQSVYYYNAIFFCSSMFYWTLVAVIWQSPQVLSLKLFHIFT